METLDFDGTLTVKGAGAVVGNITMFQIKEGALLYEGAGKLTICSRGTVVVETPKGRAEIELKPWGEVDVGNKTWVLDPGPCMLPIDSVLN